MGPARRRRPNDTARALFKQWRHEQSRGSSRSAGHFLDSQAGLDENELVETSDGDAIVVRYPDGTNDIIPTDPGPRPATFEATVGRELTRKQLREGSTLWMPQFRESVEDYQGELDLDGTS